MAYDNDYYFWSNVTPTRENRYDDAPLAAWQHQCGAMLKEQYRGLWTLFWLGFQQDLDSREVCFKQAERVLLNWLLIKNNG